MPGFGRNVGVSLHPGHDRRVLRHLPHSLHRPPGPALPPHAQRHHPAPHRSRHHPGGLDPGRQRQGHAQLRQPRRLRHRRRNRQPLRSRPAHQSAAPAPRATASAWPLRPSTTSSPNSCPTSPATSTSRSSSSSASSTRSPRPTARRRFVAPGASLPNIIAAKAAFFAANHPASPRPAVRRPPIPHSAANYPPFAAPAWVDRPRKLLS